MPSKAKPFALSPRFLFVNQDAKTIARGSKDPDLHREKQSHVQRQNFTRRKQLKEEQALLSESEPTSRGPSSLGDIPADSQESFDEDFLDSTSISGSQPRNELKQYLYTPNWKGICLHAGHVYKPRQHAESSLTQHQRNKPVSSAGDFHLQRHPLQARTVHPIFSGPTQILEKWAPPLIEHFNTMMIPEKFFADSRVTPLKDMRHALAIHSQSATALTEPVHLYSFLAAASVQMLAREGRLLLPDIKEDDYHRVPLYFKGKAIQALRQALATGITHDLVHDVQRLVSVAYWSHSYNSALPHLEAMASMIDQLGGLQTFGHHFQEINILLDWSAALRTLSTPRLPFDWDPRQGSLAISKKLRLTDTSHSELGQHMLSKFAEIEMPSQLLEPFQDLIQVTRFHRWAKDEPYEPEYFRHILMRQLSIGCRLLFMGRQCAREEALRIAMIYWTALTRSPVSGRRCASMGIAKLREVLESSGLDYWEGHDDLLLWIAIIGGLVAMTQPMIDWFASLAARTAKRVDQGVYTDFARMEDLLTGFLYEPSMQRERLLDFRANMRRVDLQ